MKKSDKNNSSTKGNGVVQTTFAQEGLDESEIYTLFTSLDQDHNGNIEYHELQRALKKLGMPIRDGQMRRMFKSMDTNGDGRISFQEFYSFVKKQYEELRVIFNAYDRDRDGFIDAKELRASIKDVGIDYDEQEVDRIMSRFATTDGRIRFTDWVQTLLLVPGSNRIKSGLTPIYHVFNPKTSLRDINPAYTAGLTEKEAKEVIDDLREEFGKIEERCFVAGKHSILLVLQGLDTGGKDGAIKVLLSGVNAAGARVESFKKPTEVELSHDFLWRCHQVCPQKGQLVVFNRSHYEDVLVVKLLKLVSEETIKERYNQINQWEEYLSANGTIVIKAMLHISKNEQKNRLFRRQVEHPWKLSSTDWPTHDQYDKYIDIYDAAFRATGTKKNPWHIIPADCKWFRDVAILRLMIDVLRPYADVWKADVEAKKKASSPYARPLPGPAKGENKPAAKL